MSKTFGLVYYTNNYPAENIFKACQKQLNKCMEIWKFPIYSISKKPIDFGINTVVDFPNGLLSMYKQIQIGLEQCQTDYIFLIEHDLLYHPTHFDVSAIEFKPNHFYYNRNQWHVKAPEGNTVTYLHNDTSMLVAPRDLLLAHIKRAVEVNTDRFHSSYGISPPRGIPPEEQKGKHYGTYFSKFPTVDIRHPNTLTRVRMTKDQFRSENSRRGWTESDGIPSGWGPNDGYVKTQGRFNEFIASI